MNILFMLVVAAMPSAVSAQAAGDTLRLVEEISVSAASNPDLARAREEAAKPFVNHVPSPQQGHQVRGGHQTHPPQPQHPVHPAHPAHPSHPVTPSHPVPPQVHPPYPYNPYPHNPGWNPNPYPPHHPYPGWTPPPGGPGHEVTPPVVHKPVSKSTWAMAGGILLAILLIVILL